MVSQSGRAALPGDHPAPDSRLRAVAAGFGGMAGRVEEDEPGMTFDARPLPRQPAWRPEIRAAHGSCEDDLAATMVAWCDRQRMTKCSSRRRVPSAARSSTFQSPARSALMVLLLNVRYPLPGLATTRSCMT